MENTVVRDLTRHGCKGCEFVRGSLRVLTSQTTHQRTLSDRWETDEADTGNTSSGDIEASAASTTTSRGGEQLALELGQFGLELTQMIGGRLVLLSLGHLCRAEKKSLSASFASSVIVNGWASTILWERANYGKRCQLLNVLDKCQTYFGLDLFDL